MRLNAFEWRLNMIAIRMRSKKLGDASLEQPIIFSGTGKLFQMSQIMAMNHHERYTAVPGVAGSPFLLSVRTALREDQVIGFPRWQPPVQSHAYGAMIDGWSFMYDPMLCCDPSLPSCQPPSREFSTSGFNQQHYNYYHPSLSTIDSLRLHFTWRLNIDLASVHHQASWTNNLTLTDDYAPFIHIAFADILHQPTAH